MTETPRRRAEVTVIVTIGDETQTFTADATTTGEVSNAADQVLTAVRNDAQGWIWAVGKRLRF